MQAKQAGRVLTALDVAEAAFGDGGAGAGQQTGEGGRHDAGEAAPVDGEREHRDADVQPHVVAEHAQHGAPPEFDEDEEETEKDGKAGCEHGENSRSGK